MNSADVMEDLSVVSKLWCVNIGVFVLSQAEVVVVSRTERNPSVWLMVISKVRKISW